MLKKKKRDNSQIYLDIINQWLILKQKDVRIEQYIAKRGWKRVAIYGMGIYARHLIREWKFSDTIEIVCGIDVSKKNAYMGIKTVFLDQVPDDVDVIINTIVYDEDVSKKIKAKASCDVLSLEDLIFESYGETRK